MAGESKPPCGTTWLVESKALKASLKASRAVLDIDVNSVFLPREPVTSYSMPAVTPSISRAGELCLSMELELSRTLSEGEAVKVSGLRVGKVS